MDAVITFHTVVADATAGLAGWALGGPAVEFIRPARAEAGGSPILLPVARRVTSPELRLVAPNCHLLAEAERRRWMGPEASIRRTGAKGSSSRREPREHARARL